MWIAETYDDITAVQKSGKQIFLRWDDYTYNGHKMTRFFTGYTDEHVLFTFHAAEVEGGIMGTISEQSQGEDLENQAWLQIIRSTVQSIANYSQPSSHDVVFERLPEWQRNGLMLFQTMSVGKLMVNRLRAGHAPHRTTTEEHDDMSICHGVVNRKPANAVAFLNQQGDAFRAGKGKTPPARNCS